MTYVPQLRYESTEPFQNAPIAQATIMTQYLCKSISQFVYLHIAEPKPA
jgi:hypothetical protein